MTWNFLSKILETLIFIFFFLYYFVKTDHKWLVQVLFLFLYYRMIALRKQLAKKPGRLLHISLLIVLMDQVSMYVLRFLPRPLKKLILYCMNFLSLRLSIVSCHMLIRGIKMEKLDFLYTGLLILLVASMILTSCAANFLGLVSGSRSTRKVHIQLPNSPKKIPQLSNFFKKVLRAFLVIIPATLIPVSESSLMGIHSLLLIK